MVFIHLIISSMELLTELTSADFRYFAGDLRCVWIHFWLITSREASTAKQQCKCRVSI